jgi:hypothetical protein
MLKVFTEVIINDNCKTTKNRLGNGGLLQVFKQGGIIQFRLKMEFKLGNVLTTLNKIIPMSFKHSFKAKLN